MSEELRHKFRRQDFYALLFAFFSVSMTFIIFTSTAVATISCSSGQFVTAIGTTNDACGKPLVEHGSGSCTIPVVGAPRCSVTITFPTAFTSTPDITFSSITGAVFETIVSGTLYLFKTVPQPTTNLPISTMYFTTNASTWRNMPIAKTELFGSTNFRLNFSKYETNLTPIIHFKVLTASTNSSAELRLQSSTDGGSTWADVTGCIVTFGTGTGYFNSSLCGLLTSSITNGITFRILGDSGAGSGDNPTFQYIYLELYAPSSSTWFNFPTSAQCPFTIQTSITIPDSCEFQFTNSSRAVLQYTGYIPLINLVVDCRIPSNTAGAFLGLQVANYSATTGTNSSNFIDAFGGHQVRFIDNAVHNGFNNRCPGTIITADGAFSSLVTTGAPPVGGGWIFRVFGSAGGGAGDTPQFGDIHLQIESGVNRVVQVAVTTHTTTSFTTFAYLLTSPTVATPVTFNWIATNTP